MKTGKRLHNHRARVFGSARARLTKMNFYSNVTSSERLQIELDPRREAKKTSAKNTRAATMAATLNVELLLLRAHSSHAKTFQLSCVCVNV